uniref:MDM2 binding protein n=1 Tax=Cyclopterus lumpus TaxID=8103 RepID=A0A8C2X8Y0_CYCLU
PIKDLLPLLGALKHMSYWHAAKITVVTQHTAGWQKAASYLSASLVEPADLHNCMDHRELWRGGLVIREKKVRTSELSGRNICKKNSNTPALNTISRPGPLVFHYYAPVLDLVQLVNLSDLPSFLISTTQFELYPLCVSVSGNSMKAKLLLDQLRSLRGKVGALFSLSCIITPIAQHAASQLSSQRWRESVARRPKSLPVPDVEVKGESAHYLLLVQGSDDVGFGGCRVRMLHSDSQINGAAAMATVSGLLREKSLSSPGKLSCHVRRGPRWTGGLSRVNVGSCLRGIYQMDHWERPAEPSCFFDLGFPTISHLLSDWPERSVLHNIENLQRRRQKRRFGLLGPGSSDSLLGPKDSQKSSSALLDARELLKHFTSDGLPTGELHLLAINRGNNVFQLSPDLSPRRISQMPFNKASVSHYHGIEFCLDNQRSLDRDQAFVKLQSRLIRYETQTTCSKEPCALPFTLSPAPSPAVMSEPGSVPDGETLQNADVARLKRRSWDTDIIGGYPRKRLVKSESNDSLCSQSSGSSGTHPAIRSLRQQPSRSQSTASGVCMRVCLLCSQMLQEVVAKALKHHGIAAEHECFEACGKRLFDISKFYLKDLKTSRGLHEEMKKAASSNVKQVIDWVLEKSSKN